MGLSLLSNGPWVFVSGSALTSNLLTLVVGTVAGYAGDEAHLYSMKPYC